MSAQTKAPLTTYLEFLQEGKLAYQFSPAAQRAVFFPRLVCPYTGDERLEWRISSGLGTVYSTTAVASRDGMPYNVALVDCDEGFRLMTRIEQVPADQVRIGMRVKFSVFRPQDDEPYPVFTPVAGA